MALEGCFEYGGRRNELVLDEACCIVDAADRAGIMLNTSCAREGRCGGCAVDLLEGTFELSGRTLTVEPGQRRRVLGCQTKIVRGPWRIAIPARSLVQSGEQVVAEFELPGGFSVAPAVRRLTLSLPRASLDDPAGDFERVARVLRAEGVEPLCPTLPALRKLPEVIAAGKYRVSVTVQQHRGGWELTDVEPAGSPMPVYGLAVDVGTTTVVCCLVDLASGRLVDRVSSYNQQLQRCEDVASRISYAARPGGLEQLRELVVDRTLNRLIGVLCGNNGLARERIVRVVVSGNTIMTHLLLGLSPHNMGAIPFQPCTNRPGSFRAADVGVAIHPAGLVDVVPSIAAYVGGDITSDIHVCGMLGQDELAALIDIGTNAEIVIGNRRGLMACATPAGPAFEGGGLRCGMRAAAGAIETLAIDPTDFSTSYRVIGGVKPSGLCGSGLIDFLAEARRTGLIDPAGRFRRDLCGSCARLRRADTPGGRMLEYVLVPAGETDDGTDLVISEKDIEALLQAKAVVYAGLTILLKQLGKTLDDLRCVYLAGGFARHINLANAIAIGLLPDIPVDRYRLLGNASLGGAFLGLVDASTWAAMDRITTVPKVIELNQDPDFEDEFAFAMFLPNRKIERFPRVAAAMDAAGG